MFFDVIGITLIATPFAAMFIFMSRAFGVKVVALGFFIVVVVMALTATGIYILTYESPVPPITLPIPSFKNG